MPAIQIEPVTIERGWPRFVEFLWCVYRGDSNRVSLSFPKINLVPQLLGADR